MGPSPRHSRRKRESRPVSPGTDQPPFSSSVGGPQAHGQFLHWAADEELVSPAIVARMKLPKPPKKVIRPFSVDDIQRLLDAAKQGKQPARDTAVLLILFDTGIWTQELCNP